MHFPVFPAFVGVFFQACFNVLCWIFVILCMVAVVIVVVLGALILLLLLVYIAYSLFCGLRKLVTGKDVDDDD